MALRCKIEGERDDRGNVSAQIPGLARSWYALGSQQQAMPHLQLKDTSITHLETRACQPSERNMEIIKILIRHKTHKKICIIYDFHFEKGHKVYEMRGNNDNTRKYRFISICTVMCLFVCLHLHSSIAVPLAVTVTALTSLAEAAAPPNPERVQIRS